MFWSLNVFGPLKKKGAGCTRLRRALAAAFLVAVAAAGTAGGESKIIDRIIAVVEDEAIFKSDVDQLIRQYMLQEGRTTISEEDREALFQRFLKELIDNKLVIAQAGRLDVSIPFSEVEDKVTKAIADNTRALGGQEAFERQLEREGFTLEGLKALYREQIRSRMLVQRVLEMEVRQASLDVSEAELQEFYREKEAELPKRPAVVHLRTIFIGFESSEQAKQNALAKIEDLHRRLVEGEPFEELAKANSEDPSAATGGDLGFVSPRDLADPKFAAAAAALSVGEISEPVLTAYGYHIIQVTDKNPDTGDVRLRHILVRLSASENDVADVYSRATDVYRQLQAGASFEELADKYSSDPNASAGGDLGWLRVGDLPEFFQDVLAGMKPGDISQVLRESAGFRIVKLIERENERPYRYEEIKTELRNMYDNEKMETSYTKYIDGLRDEFSVELR